jgi:competence protein ComFC
VLSHTNTINLLYDAGLALFYPQACAVCGASVESRMDGVACAGCWQGTRLFSSADTLCWKCGAPAPAQVESADSGRKELIRCHRCDGASFTAARACGLYEGALRASIIALKRESHVPRNLAVLMSGTCKREPLNRATCIGAVPLHPEREKQRGFNQAALLAEELSKLAQLPFVDRVLVRTQHTGRHRAGMDAQARRESVENAFVVAHPRLIEGEHILLVDDVFTTGATVSACARVLLEAGAEQVLVLTVARPVR